MARSKLKTKKKRNRDQLMASVHYEPADMTDAYGNRYNRYQYNDGDPTVYVTGPEIGGTQKEKSAARPNLFRQSTTKRMSREAVKKELKKRYNFFTIK